MDLRGSRRLVFPVANCDHNHLVAWKRSLKRERLLRQAREPSNKVGLCQQYRHCLCMDRPYDFVRLCRKERIQEVSPSTGAAFVPRVPVQGRQMPANANSGRVSLRANQYGTFG